MPETPSHDETPPYSPRVPMPPEASPDYTDAGAPADEEDPRTNAGTNAMTQESALTPEEIEALDHDLGTSERQPAPTEQEREIAVEEMAVRSQEPEAKS